MLTDIIKNFSIDYNYIILGINIFTIAIMLVLYRSLKNTKQRWNKVNDYICDITKTVDSIRYGNLSKKIKALDSLNNSENLSESLNRMIETLHDREIMITEYQNELAKQNKLLEGIINSLSDGLIIIDSECKILRVTPNVASWFKYEGKKLLGTKLDSYIELSAKKPIVSLDNDEVIIKTVKNLNFTGKTVVLKSEDKHQRYIVILKNITDQKELETLKEDFVATLTHDLKVPIIAETNMIELFLEGSFGKINEKQQLALKNMQTSNKELLDLVQVVLETYKMRDGKITLYKENILLKNFITEIIEEMQPIAAKSKNEINFILDRDIRVFADRFQIKRVLKNLIQNAILYSKPQTPIEIKIGEIPQFITIKVKDYGVGISKDDIDKIFDRYYSAAKKFRKIGTGLGLYLALQICKAHNGDLTVDSKDGESTEFCIKIPIQKYDENII